MKKSNGYYSEPMETLEGRLHVTPHSVTLELILSDLDGKRRIASIALDHTTSSKLKEDWEECCRRSENGETHTIETSDRSLLCGIRPAMTIYKSYGLIGNASDVEKISSEIAEASVRGHQIQALLFTPDSQAAEAECKPLPPHVEHQEDVKPALGQLLDTLSKWTETQAERQVCKSAPMPDMNNYDNLGDAPFLQMVRNLSFTASDTDILRAKAVLLLSIMDLIAIGKIRTKQITPTSLLKKKYETGWARNVGRECTKDFKTAFLILNDERFWRLESSVQSDYGESTIPGIKFAIMDNELFDAMTNGVNRGKLRLILTARCK